MSDQPQEPRVTLLIQALKDPHVSVVWNASRDLAKMGPTAVPALPALAETLRHHDPTAALWARYAIAQITGDVQTHLPAFIEALGEQSRVFPGMAAAAIAGFGTEAREAVPFLVPQLRAAHADNRWSAAGALARIGEASPAVPALIEALNDNDEKVRWYAAWALGEIGPSASQSVPALVRALEDIDDDVRGYSARALGKIGTPASAAAPALRLLLAEDNPVLRAEAETALAALAPKATQA